MPLQIVVPAAGEGRRFADVGYRVPKPLVSAAGVPMVVRAVRDLPPADRVVLVVRSEHVRDHQIDRQLEQFFPGCRIVTVEGLTEGQACTVRLAADALHPDWPVIVAACDNTHVYDPRRLAQLMSDPAVECLIWTYRHDTRVLVAPEQHGWVRVDGDRAVEVSCKTPISETPLNDHVVSGFFSFRTARRMIDAIDAMVQADTRIKGEFYMDVVPNLLIADRLDVRVFEVQKYVGWGTPRDLDDFHRWHRYFANLDQPTDEGPDTTSHTT
ncbi:MAG: NTP transferase domain-containing protein [Planctomycetes bacterium]|nr:NTP transferase domain-containing protein [Planctomycetota bacterium]